MYSLGASPLPVHAYDFDASARAEQPFIAGKFVQYASPSFPATGTDEGSLFRQAVTAGFVPLTAQGLETTFYWNGLGTINALKAGLLDWAAFVNRFYGVPFVSALTAGRMNAQALGYDPVAYTAALEQAYSQSGTTVPVPPSLVPVPSAATPPPTVWTPGVQILVDYRSPPSPGDGANFATVAWRSIEQDLPTAAWRASAPWVPWTDAFVHRTNDPRVVILNQQDVVYEAHNYQGVPGRLGPMWDVPSLEAAIASGGPGSPPPVLALVDVLTPSSQIRPAIPSGSPIPAEGPTLKPWTDVAVLPPSGGTFLPAPIRPPPFPGPSGGGPVQGALVPIVGGPIIGGRPSPPSFLVVEEPRPAGPGLLMLGLGAGVLWLASRTMRRRRG